MIEAPHKLNTDTYLDFVQYLKTLTDNNDIIDKISMITSSGNFLSEYDISKENIKVCDLIPIQSEIGLDKILAKIFNSESLLLNLLHEEGPKILGFPILVYNNKYIIDGHHRWAQIYIVNPDTEISCININGISDIEVLLCKLQFNIAMHTPNNLNGESHTGINIFKCTKSNIKSIIVKFDFALKQAIFNILNLNGNIDVALVDFLYKNIKSINKPIKGSLNREDMPQVFDSPPLTSIMYKI